MEEYPTSSAENNNTQAEYPSFEEHMARMRGESGNENNSSSEFQSNIEAVKTPEQRQVEDLEVLFSFCDRKDILEILKSDSYGTLLDNEVSLLDLFNANTLFDERYYADGYTVDSDWRNGYSSTILQRDPMVKVHSKQSRYDFDKRQRIERIGYLTAKGGYDEYKEMLEEDDNPPLDTIRARDAKATISEIANLYFGDNSSDEKADEIKNIIKVRANGEELSEKQKNFLREEHNFVADRLLYDGHVINEERANNIKNTIKDTAENIGSKEELDENDRATLMNCMAYAKGAIDDYIEADRPDLVYGAQAQLRNMVDDHFDILVSTDIINIGDDIDRYEAIDGLIFGYSNPYLLPGRAKEFGLCEHDHDDVDRYNNFGFGTFVIDNPDRILDYIASSDTNATADVARKAKLLKELGVSEEAILRNCQLRPIDFTDAYSSGSVLVDAGINRKKIIKEVFIPTTGLQDKSPFEKIDGFFFKGKSYVDTLEKNGFDITDIAKTFSPDAVAANIGEFIERGADAKELMKYMASYREKFEDNIVQNAKGDIDSYRSIWLDGTQNMIVWDEDHPDGRMVRKEGMRGDGIDYVAINLDTFADNGVTEEDIINQISGKQAMPFGMFIPKMLECRKFNTQKILTLGYAKYTEYLKKMEEAGYFDKEYVEKASNPSDYYAKIIEQMSGSLKGNRDKYYRNLIEAK